MKEYDENNGGALTISNNSANSLIPLPFQKTGRRSGLQSHNMMLSGHDSTVYSLCFDGTGQNICSAGMDSKICTY